VKAFIFALSFAVGTVGARAEVLDSQAGGFTVRQTVSINAPAAKVWPALTKPGLWWDPAHTYSNDAKNLALDLRTGGAWTERLPDGGGVTHLTVVYLAPLKVLRLEGALGPLQSMGVAGHLTYVLAQKDGATTLTATYDVGGHAPGGLDKLAAPVDGVLGGQIQRLKREVETGKPD
jgi:uncharacterized protein YndB with AHSA1/START domain